MLDGYQILTVTHRDTPLKTIGDFVVTADGEEVLREQLHQLCRTFELDELMYTATCNRVMYFFYTPTRFSQTDIAQFFRTINPKLSAESIRQHAHHLIGDRALSHLYNVAASIDSLVVGEREILRQLRDSYEQSKSFDLIGDHLRLAMDHAVNAAKAVYAKTRIGEKPVSVVSLAIQELLRYQLPRQSRILLVGAGQTNNLVAKFLKKHEYSNVVVFNRTLARAQSVARTVSGRAYPLDSLFSYREGFDCIVCCTGWQEAFLNEELYRDLLNGEEDQKLVIDLAIPNNVDRAITESFDVQYIEIEDLREAARKNMEFRRREVVRAEAILTTHITEFATLFQQRQITRALRHVPQQIKQVRQHALTEVFAKEMADLDEDALDLVHRMMAYMERRCIGIPMQAARESVGTTGS